MNNDNEKENQEIKQKEDDRKQVDNSSGIFNVSENNESQERILGKNGKVRLRDRNRFTRYLWYHPFKALGLFWFGIFLIYLFAVMIKGCSLLNEDKNNSSNNTQLVESNSVKSVVPIGTFNIDDYSLNPIEENTDVVVNSVSMFLNHQVTRSQLALKDKNGLDSGLSAEVNYNTGSAAVFTIDYNFGYRGTLLAAPTNYQYVQNDINIIVINIGIEYSSDTSSQYAEGSTSSFYGTGENILFVWNISSNYPLYKHDTLIYPDTMGYPLTSCLIPKNDLYNSGYTDGYSDGQRAGYNSGYSEGERVGYINGKADGSDLNVDLNNTFLAVFDAPFSFIYRMLNFEIWGINFWYVFTALISILLILFIIRLLF